MENGFCIIYSFQVHDGKVEQFIQAWKNLTELIYQHRGSLGSRLHKLSELEYIAYAVWPDREIFDDVNAKLPDTATIHREAMRNACSNIETKYELQIVEDLIQNKPFDN